MTSSTGPAPARAGELRAFDIGCVVVGGIIGVGIFFTPARVAAAVDTGSEVILAWSLGGVLAVLGAFVFAELATLVPGHGGTFRYLHAAFGPLPSFLYGWTNWLVIQAGALGVVGLILVDNLEVVLGRAAFAPAAKVWIAAAFMFAFTLTNVIGLRTGKRVQNALTVLKVVALLVLVSLAFVTPAATDAASPLPAPPGDAVPGTTPETAARVPHASVLAMLAAAILPVLFAIGGWQQGSFLAGAAARPRRDVPLGILGGVAVVIVAYLTVNLAYLSLLGFDGASHSTKIGADAARAALGDQGGRVVAAMIVVSAAGIMNTICMAPPYVLFAMAQQGLFPAAFGRLHARLQTPVLGVLSQGCWAIVLLLLVHFVFTKGDAMTTLGFVCDGVVFADWLFFVLCGAALLRLRGTRTDALRLPGGAFAALLFTLAAAAVTAGAVWQQPEASLAGAAIVLAGAPIGIWMIWMRRELMV